MAYSSRVARDYMWAFVVLVPLTSLIFGFTCCLRGLDGHTWGLDGVKEGPEGCSIV